MNYYLGVGYQQEEGNFIKENLDRYTLKLSVEHRVSDLFSTGASINFVHGINNFGSQYGYRDILRMPNILKAHDDNGNLIAQPGIAASIQGIGNFTSSPNPLNEINRGTEEVRQYDILSSIFAEIRPLPNLSVRSSFLPRFNRTRTGQYYGIVPSQRNQDIAYQVIEEALEFTLNNVVKYNIHINSDHRLVLTLIQRSYITGYECPEVQADELPYPSSWNNLLSGSLVPDAS